MSSSRRWAPWLLSAVVVAALIGVWQWLTQSGVINQIVLPGPGAVLEQMVEVVRRDSFGTNLWATVREIVIGLVIGCAAAIATALACVRYPMVRKVVSPYITTLQAVPKITIIPLLGIWFGIGITSATIVVALVAFFPTFVNAVTGLTLSAEDGLRLLHSLGASKRQAFVMYRIPTALPLVFTGLKSSINYAVVAAITTEFLGSNQGLGHLVTSATTFLRIPDVYATVAAISVLAASIFVIVELLDRKLIFWRGETSGRRSRRRQRRLRAPEQQGLRVP